MPLKLFNILVSFQDYINNFLANKLNVFNIIYVDNIFIYIKNSNKTHIDIIWWVLDILQKYRYFVNLKKYWFYKNQVHFYGYIILVQKIKIKDNKIKIVKNWLKQKSI